MEEKTTITITIGREEMHALARGRAVLRFLPLADSGKEEGGRRHLTSLLRVSGAVEDAVPADGRKFTLAEAYALLGCGTVEVLRLGHGEILVIDEGGKLRGEYIPNAAATLLARAAGAIDTRDYIAGDALLCGDDEF